MHRDDVWKGLADGPVREASLGKGAAGCEQRFNKKVNPPRTSEGTLAKPGGHPRAAPHLCLHAAGLQSCGDSAKPLDIEPRHHIFHHRHRIEIGIDAKPCGKMIFKPLKNLVITNPLLLGEKFLQDRLGIAFARLFGDLCHLPRQIRIGMRQDIVAGTGLQALLFKIIGEFGLRQDPSLNREPAQNRLAE